MKQTDISALKLNTETARSFTDEHIKTTFNHFADQVDNQIQSTLMAQLIARYSEVSKQLEIKNKQLAQSDENRREAQEIALLGNWEMDIATKKFWWSDTMSKVLEIENSIKPNLELYFQRVHPDDLKTTLRYAKNLLKGIALTEHQYRLLMKDGRTKWVNIRSVMLRDTNGNPVSVHGTIQDITAAKETEKKLKAYSDHLEELVREKVTEISASQLATIYALVKLAESRDDDTGKHIERTSAYCRLLAEKLLEMKEHQDIVNEAFIENIANASPLHDIGKVGIPDAILLKPAKLTPEEFEIMKTHVTIGYETLASVQKTYTMNEFIKIGMDIALNHHEKWDGSGYMRHLKGEEIPLSARIMAVADVYDALRSKRVYKESYSHEKSVDILAEGKGRHFDPLLVDIFLKNNGAFRDIFDRTVHDDQ